MDQFVVQIPTMSEAVVIKEAFTVVGSDDKDHSSVSPGADDAINQRTDVFVGVRDFFIVDVGHVPLRGSGHAQQLGSVG